MNTQKKNPHTTLGEHLLTRTRHSVDCNNTAPFHTSPIPLTLRSRTAVAVFLTLLCGVVLMSIFSPPHASASPSHPRSALGLSVSKVVVNLSTMPTVNMNDVELSQSITVLEEENLRVQKEMVETVAVVSNVETSVDMLNKTIVEAKEEYTRISVLLEEMFTQLKAANSVYNDSLEIATEAEVEKAMAVEKIANLTAIIATKSEELQKMEVEVSQFIRHLYQDGSMSTPDIAQIVTDKTLTINGNQKENSQHVLNKVNVLTKTLETDIGTVQEQKRTLADLETSLTAKSNAAQIAEENAEAAKTATEEGTRRIAELLNQQKNTLATIQAEEQFQQEKLKILTEKVNLLQTTQNETSEKITTLEAEEEKRALESLQKAQAEEKARNAAREALRLAEQTQNLNVSTTTSKLAEESQKWLETTSIITTKENVNQQCPKVAPGGTNWDGVDVGGLCVAAVASAPTTEAQRAILYAFNHLGSPYSQGNRLSVKPPVFDCSSFVARAYNAGGAYISKNGKVYNWINMFGSTVRYTPGVYEGTNLKRVTKNDPLKPGDVFIQFNGDSPANSGGDAGHAQMYLGVYEGDHYIIQSGGGRDSKVNVSHHRNSFNNEWVFRYTK